MIKLRKFSLIICFVALLTLILGVGVFNDPQSTAFADTQTYTVTFKKGGLGNTPAENIGSITVNEGESILESDLPTNELPALVNAKYIWFYSPNGGGTLHKASITGDESHVVIENVSSNIVFWAVVQDTSERHKVTFIMPDSTIVTKTVADGGTVDGPVPELGFCQRVKYDKSLENIHDDMTVTVTIDNTLKYVFMAGCIALLVASIVVIVVIIFKTLNLPDDDEEDGLVVAKEASIKVSEETDGLSEEDNH